MTLIVKSDGVAKVFGFLIFVIEKVMRVFALIADAGNVILMLVLTSEQVKLAKTEGVDKEHVEAAVSVI